MIFNEIFVMTEVLFQVFFFFLMTSFGWIASQCKYQALWITEFQNVAKVLSARKE